MLTRDTDEEAYKYIEEEYESILSMTVIARITKYLSDHANTIESEPEDFFAELATVEKLLGLVKGKHSIHGWLELVTACLGAKSLRQIRKKDAIEPKVLSYLKTAQTQIETIKLDDAEKKFFSSFCTLSSIIAKFRLHFRSIEQEENKLSYLLKKNSGVKLNPEQVSEKVLKNLLLERNKTFSFIKPILEIWSNLSEEDFLQNFLPYKTFNMKPHLLHVFARELHFFSLFLIGIKENHFKLMDEGLNTFTQDEINILYLLLTLLHRSLRIFFVIVPTITDFVIEFEIKNVREYIKNLELDKKRVGDFIAETEKKRAENLNILMQALEPKTKAKNYYLHSKNKSKYNASPKKEKSPEEKTSDNISNDNNEISPEDEIYRVYALGKYDEAIEKLKKIRIRENEVNSTNRLKLIKQLPLFCDCYWEKADWEYLHGTQQAQQAAEVEFAKYVNEAQLHLSIGLIETEETAEYEVWQTWQDVFSDLYAPYLSEEQDIDVEEAEANENVAKALVKPSFSFPLNYPAKKADEVQIKKLETPQLQELIQKFHNCHFHIYIVGGRVRDVLMGKEATNDIDLATTAPLEIAKNFLGQNAKIVSEKMPIVLGGTKPNCIEIACLSMQPSHTHTVKMVTLDNKTGTKIPFTPTFDIEEDVKHRDLTINSFYYDPKDKLFLDPTGYAFQDLEKGIARVLYADYKFSEDPLRMLRTIRFAIKNSFVIEHKTHTAILKNCEKILTEKPRRLAEEISKLFTGKNIRKTFDALNAYGLLNILFPATKKFYDRNNNSLANKSFADILNFLDKDDTLIRGAQAKIFLFASLLWFELEMAIFRYGVKDKDLANKMELILDKQSKIIHLYPAERAAIKKLWYLTLNKGLIDDRFGKIKMDTIELHSHFSLCVKNKSDVDKIHPVQFQRRFN